MADNLKLSVVTPEGSLFSGEATFVAAPAWDGEVGILPGHADYWMVVTLRMRTASPLVLLVKPLVLRVGDLCPGDPEAVPKLHPMNGHFVRPVRMLSPRQPERLAQLPEPVAALRVRRRAHAEDARPNLHELDAFVSLSLPGRLAVRVDAVADVVLHRRQPGEGPRDHADAEEEERQDGEQNAAAGDHLGSERVKAGRKPRTLSRRTEGS